MNQAHLLLLYKFPEDESEVFMPYLDGEEQALTDGRNFYQMYPEVLYVTIVRVDEQEQETVIWTWNNPRAATLLRRLSNAGPASLLSPTTSDFAPYAGSSSPRRTEKSTTSPLGARPPLAGLYDSPLPDISKTYGGRKRTRRNRTWRG